MSRSLLTEDDDIVSNSNGSECSAKIDNSDDDDGNNSGELFHRGQQERPRQQQRRQPTAGQQHRDNSGDGIAAAGATTLLHPNRWDAIEGSESSSGMHNNEPSCTEILLKARRASGRDLLVGDVPLYPHQEEEEDNKLLGVTGRRHHHQETTTTTTVVDALRYNHHDVVLRSGRRRPSEQQRQQGNRHHDEPAGQGILSAEPPPGTPLCPTDAQPSAIANNRHSWYYGQNNLQELISPSSGRTGTGSTMNEDEATTSLETETLLDYYASSARSTTGLAYAPYPHGPTTNNAAANFPPAPPLHGDNDASSGGAAAGNLHRHHPHNNSSNIHHRGELPLDHPLSGHHRSGSTHSAAARLSASQVQQQALPVLGIRETEVLELGPGLSLPYKNEEETMASVVEHGRCLRSRNCVSCSEMLYCIDVVAYVLCPYCNAVSALQLLDDQLQLQQGQPHYYDLKTTFEKGVGIGVSGDVYLSWFQKRRQLYSCCHSNNDAEDDDDYEDQNL